VASQQLRNRVQYVLQFQIEGLRVFADVEYTFPYLIGVIVSPLPDFSAATTLSTSSLSNFGSRQSTEFSLSLPGMRRANAARTMRPSNCAMYVWSFARKVLGMLHPGIKSRLDIQPRLLA
jgi:hypothetical protein